MGNDLAGLVRDLQRKDWKMKGKEIWRRGMWVKFPQSVNIMVLCYTEVKLSNQVDKMMQSVDIIPLSSIALSWYHGP